MMKHPGCRKTMWVLVVIGALNWGLVGIGMLVGSDWNVVNMIVGQWPTLEAIIYVLVGLSVLPMIGGCKNCKMSS